METTARREEILGAALEVFAERGYRRSSIDAVAERAGLTRQGVLHYFPSKKRLLRALLQRREDLARAHLAAGHADKDLPSRVAEVVAYDHRNAGLVQIHSVLVAEGIVRDDPAHGFFRDHYRSIQDNTVAHLTEIYGDRLPSGLTPRAAASALVAMLDGMQLQWLLDDERSDYPEIMRDVMTLLIGSTPE
ncbi:helix-turn-helix domain-containing protein [Streptomyces sp. ADMS]|uniref:TetR/AcrR family transcriptional regulator n=1 Tax=Streptomyces sp. ADMS TaxID=3071415 RepID=UPI00296F98EA|nr:helix-turn-helix domain-containing protein [Streptomyces sp. ADMS]MDW4904015.1 helix-turn-helix domain-containing protein [Streptomyces sp. ADMS]